MKLGLISDIHGNSIALRAVISDAKEVGVTHWWVLGDLVAIGPDPVGVMECLEGLDNLRAIAGNTERYVLRGDRPYPTVDEAGTRVLGVHASPDADDGAGIDNRISDPDLADLLRGCEADVVFAGHTHDATDRRVGGIRAVNLGSVSNSHRPDRSATYAILDVSPDSHTVTHRVVPYDLGSAIRAIHDVRHPAAGFLERFLTVS